MRSWIACLTAAVLACAGFASGARAQFYAGKTVRVLVNYPAGGPSDIEARVIGKYLGRHIAGKPTVLTVNMGGAGGLIATNYLGEIAKNDPLQVAFFTWNPMTQILSDPALRVGYDKFRMVAGFRQPAIVYIRRDVKPGLNKPVDLLAAEPFIVGALAANTHTTLRSALALDLLGVKYRMVTGYAGLKEVELAVMKGEVQAASTSLAGYTGSIESAMVEPGIVMPAFQYDVEDAAGRLGRSDALPDMPTFLELYRAKTGAKGEPTGPRWAALQLISSIMDNLYRAAFLPPNAGDEPVAEMRKAFAALSSDQDFVADYLRVVGVKPAILGGVEAEAVIGKLRSTDPAVTNFLDQYVKDLTGHH